MSKEITADMFKEVAKKWENSKRPKFTLFISEETKERLDQWEKLENGS